MSLIFRGPRPVIGAVLALGLMSACASAPSSPPRLEVRPVAAPIPVRCTPNLGPEPDYPDTDSALQAAPDLFARVRLLVAGRLMRIARDAEKSAALQACAG